MAQSPVGPRVYQRTWQLGSVGIWEAIGVFECDIVDPRIYTCSVLY